MLTVRRLAAVVLAASVALGGCSESKTPSGQSGSATTTANGGPIAFSVGALYIEAAKPPAQADVDKTRDDVLSTLNTYLENGVLSPLRNGGPASDISEVFSSSARGQVAGPHHAAMVDEGLPAVRDLEAERAVLELTVFAGQGGEIIMVSAGFDVKLSGRVDGDDFRLDRTGEFLLVPDSGAWRVDGYDVRVSRDAGAGSTTTTARR